MSFEEKSQQEIGKLTNIDYSEKENGPRASSAPALGLNTIIFKHVFWYMQQISGERLQDHWSSGFGILVPMNFRNSGKMPLILVREFWNLVIEKSVKSQGILLFMICGNPDGSKTPILLFFNPKFVS